MLALFILNLQNNPEKIISEFNEIKKKTMEKKVIDKATSDKISFMTYIVPAFADAYKMKVQDAYFYLKKYGGWDFLKEHWWAFHTDSTFWTVRSIYNVCYQNGGLK